MKKFLLLLVCGALFCGTSILTSCEKEDNETYYAGESEEDYKPNTYTITSEWDFSGVEGLSQEQKAQAEVQFSEAINTSAVFDTREEAVAAFDAVVYNLSEDPDFSSLHGLKAKLRLMRGNAIIKSADLSW